MQKMTQTKVKQLLKNDSLIEWRAMIKMGGLVDLIAFPLSFSTKSLVFITNQMAIVGLIFQSFSISVGARDRLKVTLNFRHIDTI